MNRCCLVFVFLSHRTTCVCVCVCAHVVGVQLLDFLDYHPCAFISLIQRALEFAVGYLFTPAGEGVTFERFTVQCMNLIKMIVKNDAYKPAKNIEGEDAERERETRTRAGRMSGGGRGAGVCLDNVCAINDACKVFADAPK